MKAKHGSPLRTDPAAPTFHRQSLDRRTFLRQSLVFTGGFAVCFPAVTSGLGQGQAKPLGVAKGIHPGRVVWVHDPEVTDWKGPGRWPLVGGQAGEAGARGRHDGAGGLRIDRRGDRGGGVVQAVPPLEPSAGQG